MNSTSRKRKQEPERPILAIIKRLREEASKKMEIEDVLAKLRVKWRLLLTEEQKRQFDFENVCEEWSERQHQYPDPGDDFPGEDDLDVYLEVERSEVWMDEKPPVTILDPLTPEIARVSGKCICKCSCGVPPPQKNWRTVGTQTCDSEDENEEEDDSSETEMDWMMMWNNDRPSGTMYNREKDLYPWPVMKRTYTKTFCKFVDRYGLDATDKEIAKMG